MRLGTLGGLRLEGASFSRPKPLLLLTYLALEGPRDRPHLAELFWPRAKNRRRSLNVALAQLREGAPGSVRDDGGALVAGIPCDATRFLEDVEAEALEDAEGAYAGAFLEGVRPAVGHELEEWILGTREVLAAHARQVLLALAERDAAAGRFREAAGRAERAWSLTGAPFPEPRELERLHALLVANDDPRAREVAREAASFDLELTATPTTARRAFARLTRSADGPAVDGAPFVGRMDERRTVLEALGGGERLVVLMGPPGVGKTRLAQRCAVHVGREGGYQGVHVVPLEGARSVEEACAAIAAALGRHEERSGADVPALARRIADRRLLLVLDGFEALAPDAAMLSELLAGCPRLQLLVTSRERLHLAEERAELLAGLPVPGEDVEPSDAVGFAAVQLFAELAGRARPGFRLEDADLPSVVAICRRVDGLPLGLELAAAWTRLMAVEEIADELARGLELLEGRRRDAPPRHRSMRAAFEASWRLLSESERAAFVGLAAFRGPFRRRDAQEVAGATIPVLAALVDKSLVRAEPPDRFRLHPLLAELGRERAAARGEEEARLRRHAEHFLSLAERARPHLTGPDSAVWLGRLETAHDDLHAALDWLEEHEPERALRLATASWRYWVVRGHNREGRVRLERLLHATADAGASRLRARSLRALATLTFQTGDFVGAAPRFRAALAEAREADDAALVASLLHGVAWTDVHLGEIEQGVRHARDALQLARRLGDGRGEALAHNGLAFGAFLTGDVPTMREHLLVGIATFDALGDERGVAHLRTHLAMALRLLGERGRARELIALALETLQRIGDKQLRIWALLQRADLGLDDCRADEAGDALAEAVPLVDDVGNGELSGAIHTARAEVALARGRPEDASSALRGARDAWRCAGYPWMWAHTDRVAARAARLAGESDAAARWLVSAVRRSSRIGDRLGLVLALEEAVLQATTSAPATAAARLGAARAGRRRLGVRAAPRTLRELRPAARQVRARLGSRALREAWERGRRVGPERLEGLLPGEVMGTLSGGER